MSDPKALPTPDALAEAAKLELFDVKGATVRFGSLFESNKVIFVFIR